MAEVIMYEYSIELPRFINNANQQMLKDSGIAFNIEELSEISTRLPISSLLNLCSIYHLHILYNNSLHSLPGQCVEGMTWTIALGLGAPNCTFGFVKLSWRIHHNHIPPNPQIDIDEVVVKGT
jgi:hypothetical protein